MPFEGIFLKLCWLAWAIALSKNESFCERTGVSGGKVQSSPSPLSSCWTLQYWICSVSIWSAHPPRSLTWICPPRKLTTSDGISQTLGNSRQCSILVSCSKMRKGQSVVDPCHRESQSCKLILVDKDRPSLYIDPTCHNQSVSARSLKVWIER